MGRKKEKLKPSDFKLGPFACFSHWEIHYKSSPLQACVWTDEQLLQETKRHLIAYRSFICSLFKNFSDSICKSFQAAIKRAVLSFSRLTSSSIVACVASVCEGFFHLFEAYFCTFPWTFTRLVSVYGLRRTIISNLKKKGWGLTWNYPCLFS